MLVNKLGFGNMDFRKKVKMRIGFSALFFVLGALTVGIVLSVDPFTSELTHDMSFASGFYFGLGFGLMGAGIATIIKNVRYLKNTEKFKAAEIANNDERNRYIANRTWSISAFIMISLTYLAVIIAGIYDTVIFSTLLAVLGVFGLVLLIVQIVLKKLY